MLLPRLVLWAPRGIRGGRQHRNRAAKERGVLVRERLRRCWEGEADEVYREYRRACGPRPVRPSGAASPTRTDGDEYLANEVMRLCAEGEWSRACGLLNSHGVAPRSQETATSLQALWRRVAREEVPAYQPLLTPIKIAWILFGTGIVFIIIGLSVRSVNTNDIFTRKVQYDGDGTPSANRECRTETADTCLLYTSPSPRDRG